MVLVHRIGPLPFLPSGQKRHAHSQTTETPIVTPPALLAMVQANDTYRIYVVRAARYPLVCAATFDVHTWSASAEQDRELAQL